MKPELEAKLATQFPFLERKVSLEEQEASGQITNTYYAFGYETDSGWFQLIWDMCTEITATYEKYGKPIDIIPIQIKEKFGRLKFYYQIDGKERNISAIDFLGQCSIRFTDDSSPLYKEIADIVQKYEVLSLTVCEVCGKPGKLRKDLKWILTLCDECYQIRIDKINERKRNK